MDLLEKILGSVSIILLGLATWWIKAWIREVKRELRDLQGDVVTLRISLARLEEREKKSGT